MDKKFTEKLGAWLSQPASERDYDAGNTMLLQLSGNRIVYLNFARNLERNKAHIEYQLQKYYNFRVADLTKEQVQDMSNKVDAIATKTLNPENARKGKRYDHDKLPPEIQALWDKNLVIIRKMQELHLQLRNLSLDNATCPDSERYPFLKELIKLDKEYHSNWERYDSEPCGL